ncbi:MAG: M15 family metallopeptidase [SAR324 cluster bacterium]|nr:M15 family metallopeptidase [SAR324 cluster bacterium]
MFKFSSKSKEKLDQCHPKLRMLFNQVIQYHDCTIMEGIRSRELQDEYYRTGKSKLMWPHSKHNVVASNELSRAVDVAPYIAGKGIPWNDVRYFYHFAGLVRGIAAELGIKVRSGLDWDNDWRLDDQSFHDGPHFELLEG